MKIPVKKKHTVYVVHYHSTLGGLESAINSALANGWKLQGGIAYTVYPSDDRLREIESFMQAVTKQVFD